MKQGGFTLIELIAAVVIITILTAIAVPLYLHAEERARRTQAIEGLEAIATREEAYFSRFNTYAPSLTYLSYPAASVTTDGGYYLLSVAAASATNYHLQAVPQPVGGQDKDDCGTFALDGLGKKAVTGSKSATDCWH